jgi:hypothetical protein
VSRRRKRFEDVRPAETPAKLCRRQRGESWRQRHERRKETAVSPASLTMIQNFCQSRGLTLAIKNNNHHFIIRRPVDKPGEHLAQWWPQTAKLIFRCQWSRGVHCHDAAQLIFEISRQLEKPNRE